MTDCASTRCWLTALLVWSVLSGVGSRVGVSAQDNQVPAPATPVSRYDGDNRFAQQHKEYMALAKKGGIDVLFLGDSITQQWREAGKAVWKKHFEPLKAANFGINADRTQNVLWRVQNGELDGITPKVVVVLIGTNNPDKPPDTTAGVTAIVASIRKKLPETKVLLLGIFPRGEKPGDRRDRIKQVNDLIARLDDGKMIRYLDIGPKFLREDGTIPQELMPDRFLHLSGKGYQVWADAMLPLLQEMLKE